MVEDLRTARCNPNFRHLANKLPGGIQGRLPVARRPSSLQALQRLSTLLSPTLAVLEVRGKSAPGEMDQPLLIDPMKRALKIAALLIPLAALAAEPDPRVVYTYKSVGNKPSEAVVSGLVNMDEIFDKSGDNCQQFVGTATVEGVQFSSSGATLESFRFTDKRGNQWSVPTNIGKLPGAARGAANNFIRVGRPYFLQVQICGSGGFPSLINAYSAAQFGQ
ncbi:hypothetical protein [Cupriavidus metallidurans]|nr:hypothetical protein [Cupriavidus metallidurans]